jgi:large repetitive protein
MTGWEEAVRVCILISVVCVLTAFGSVGPSGPCGTVQPGPGFDPKDVVRQVHARRDMSDMTFDAAGAMLRSGNPDHFSGRLTNRYPDPSELGPDQSLGGEFLIDTSSVLLPAPGSQNDPAIAFDGVNFLVVWEDKRSGSYTDICGARVTPDGTVLDPSGFVVSLAAYDQKYPVLGFDGTNFLVVWQDFRRGYAFDIYGTRVTPDGTVLDPAGFIVSNDPNEQLRPAIGFDSTNFLVVWQDNRNNAAENDIYGARVTPQGKVLDLEGLVISQAPGTQGSPAIAFDGASFFVAWQDDRDSGHYYIYGARVTPDGAVLDSNGIAIGRGEGRGFVPAVAFDSANFLVVWQEMRGSFPPELSIYGARVTPDGTVLDPVSIGISTAGGVQSAPALGFDGANFVAVWEDFRGGNSSDVYGARISPDGTVLDPSGIAISQAAGSQGAPCLGFDGANSFVAWHDYRNNPAESDLYGARVTPGGTVLDTGGFVIAQAAREEFTPAVASDSANFLVVWEDHRSSGSSDIYGARVSPAGAVLDPDGLVISLAPGAQGTPAVGFDGANFLVVWQDFRNSSTGPDIYGARVTPGGAVLDTDGFGITQAADAQTVPVLFFDGTDFLVVWQDRRAGSFSDIYGARVTPQGAVLDPGGIAISQATDRQCTPALGFDGANFLAVWQDYRADSGYSDIYGARVTPDGTVLDSGGIHITQVTGDQFDPALGFDGANFLVTWADYRRSSVYADIYGARVTPGGTVLDTSGFVITEAAKDQLGPALVFGTANFLVVWEDYRSSGDIDIYGAHVAPDGTVSDEGGVVRQGGAQTCLALARGTGSQLFLVFQGWTGAVGGKTYNTDRIWGDMNPNTGLGLEESQQPVTRGYRPMATVVRGALMMGDRGQKTEDRAELLDIAGRKVIDLHSGANDVRALVPGVYFVRDTGHAGQTRKVVVQR